jgi:hypothetical protein
MSVASISAAQAITVDRRHDRLPDFQPAVEQLVALGQPHVGQRRRCGQETLDVGAGRERALARAGHDGHADRRIVANRAPGLGQRLVVLGVHRIEPLRTIDGDEGNALA